MPTERFTKLCEDKKKRISEAVICEFQRTSYGELQISNIARAAKISRGSLYTYFQDKEDMFLFAMNQTWKGLLEQNKESLLAYNGDLSSLEQHFKICKSNQIYQHVNLEQFKECTEEEFGGLLDTCLSFLMVSIQQYLSDINDEKKIAEDFSGKLHQIKETNVFEIIR